MRSIFFSLLTLAATSAHAIKPDDIVGDYSEPGGVFVYSGNLELGLDGQEMVGSSDTLSIEKKSASSVDFHVTSIGGNAHVCDLSGTAKLQGETFVWIEKDPQVGVCKVSISLDKANRILNFDAEGELCRDYCGVRASLPTSFALNSRVMANGTATTRIRPARGEKLCFSRIYDTSHLRGHKGQHAASMYLSIVNEGEGHANFFDAKLVARKAAANPEKNFEYISEEDEAKQHFSAWANCPTTGASNRLECAIPSDAGSFTIKLQKDGSALVMPAKNAHGMVLESLLDADGLPTDKSERLRIVGDAENGAYMLYPALPSNCEHPF